jgi:hypothetical protein
MPLFLRLVRSSKLFWVFVIVIGLQIVGEVFPFSRFPMYASFDDEATVIYVTDASGEPLPIRRLFQTQSSNAKKIYKSELRALSRAKGLTLDRVNPELKQAAAETTLSRLWSRRTDAARQVAQPIELWQATLSISGREFVRSDEKLAAKAF